MVCQSSEKRNGKLKNKILIGIIYIGQHEHIPVNLLHRHDLTGLPNILTRKWGGQVCLHPLGQKPHCSLPLVGRCGWNTFIQGNKLPTSWLPRNMWVNKFAFLSLRPYNSQNNLSEMLGTESLASDILKQLLGCFSIIILPLWLGLDTSCNISACDETFLIGLEEAFKKGKTMVNMEEESFYTFAIEGYVTSTTLI